MSTGEKVPLEVFTDSSPSAPRYRFVGFNPHRVLRVPWKAVGSFFPDHRFDCPGHGAGLER